jgi:hypothetical protein
VAVELLGHHAALPLAVAILYQDFPFALADLFLKRALNVIALVAAAMLGVAAVGANSLAGLPLRDPRDVGLLVTSGLGRLCSIRSCAILIAWFVDSVLLDRPDYALLLPALASVRSRQQDIAGLLDDACAELAPALSARVVRWRELSEPRPWRRLVTSPRVARGRRRAGGGATSIHD